jgi:hypothetical protein
MRRRRPRRIVQETRSRCRPGSWSPEIDEKVTKPPGTIQSLRIALTTTLLITLVAAGCTHKKPVTTTAPAASLPEGKTTYSYIFDPSNPVLGLPEDVQFSRPLPMETPTLPKYPENALAANDGPHREIVRIVIDTHGIVSQVGDSPMGQSDGGPFAEDYRRSVDAAVRTWRYQPGALQHVVPGHDLDADGKPDYKVVTSRDLVAVYYDIRFTFEIVDGKGVVKATP